MKIVHVFKDYYPPTRGGVEQHLHDLVHSLPGFEFEVLTGARSFRGCVDDDGGVVVRRASELGRISTSPATPSWVTTFRRSDVDLFHFHMPNPFGELAFLASATATPMVATYHADIVGRRLLRPGFAPIQRLFLRRARRVVATSPAMLETSPLARFRQRTAVVPFGIDLGRWAPRPAAADQIRARYPGPLVLFLGRLVHYKGVDVLIEAMRNIEATLLVVGDGPKRKELEGIARARRSRAAMLFIGEVRDHERAAYYHAADVFVLPSVSRAEAFGIATLEALACGTPAVTTELGTGTSFVNLGGETGLVVPPRSASALAAAITELLADDALRRQLAAAALERVRLHFQRDTMLEQLAALYRSLVP